MRRFFVLAAALLATFAVPASARAQTREVTGKVTVAGAGTPLQDAIVGSVGAAGGARTNAAGEYRLRVPNGDVTVQVRAIGYKRQQIRVSASQSTADFALEKDVLQIEGVTITGAATTIEKKNAATAVASVNSEELARVPAPALESALQGKVVGASINMNNGAPGGGGQVQIRGASSLIGNTNPLFVVDGVAEVANLAAADIEDTPAFTTSSEKSYLLGMAKVKGKVKILLDIDQALGSQELHSLEGLTGGN